MTAESVARKIDTRRCALLSHDWLSAIGSNRISFLS